LLTIPRFRGCVGWFSSRSTRLFDAGQAEIDLTDALKEYAMTFDPEKDDMEMEKGRAQVPVFELGIVQVKHRARNNNGTHHTMSCYAVEIRCEQKNKNVLKRMIQNADLPVRKFGFFVPYGVPDSVEYSALVTEQNEYQSDDFSIVIFGMHESVLSSQRYSNGEARAVRLIDDLLGPTYTKKEGTTETAVPIVKAIEKARSSDTIGKWVIRTTQEAAEKAHQLVNNFINNANETVEHTMAAREHGGEFARGIWLTYHPDARRYKERVSARAKNIELNQTPQRGEVWQYR
jgi:hypothetical protein